MTSLIKLPLRAAELATAPTRFAVKAVWRLLRQRDDHARPAAGPPPAPAPAAPAPGPERRAAPRRRSTGAAAPSPKAARRAARHEPTRGQAGAIRRAHGGAAPAVGATIEVAAPWDGYDAMTEEQVLDRLVGADPALRAVVRLYEATHADRLQVVLATDEPSVQP